ncbi:hypothetical protein KCP75_16765 [Salmonella enterica subsp. enterica]|nr:hypothetical protein KCP75_16765 [Salmonella enterica subsp. enterica]
MRWRSPSFPLTAKCCCADGDSGGIFSHVCREGFDNGYLKDDQRHSGVFCG